MLLEVELQMTGDHYARPLRLHAKYGPASELSLQHGQTYQGMQLGSCILESRQRECIGHGELARFPGERAAWASVPEG